MTNKEIKLELARIGLERCNFSSSESLTESIRNLYEWITEETDEENDVQDNKPIDYNKEKVSKIVGHICSKYATRISNIFHDNGIETVGDLLLYSKREFTKFRNAGNKSADLVGTALRELYGINDW